VKARLVAFDLSQALRPRDTEICVAPGAVIFGSAPGALGLPVVGSAESAAWAVWDISREGSTEVSAGVSLVIRSAWLFD
jgi:hypothetical protein